MSLITRCPACGTMFKVVPDQLKVSQGWVRCGQCADVFDASLNMLPAQAAARPPLPPEPHDLPAPASTAVAQPPAPFTSLVPPVPQIPPAPSHGDPPAVQTAGRHDTSPEGGAGPADDALDAAPAVAGSGPGLAAPVEPAGAAEPVEPAPADFDPAAWKRQYSALDQVGALRRTASGEVKRFDADEIAAEPDEPPSAAMAPDEPSTAAVLPPVAVAAPSPEEPTAGTVRTADQAADEELTIDERNDVSFVRQAKRKAFWRKPAMRAAAGVAVLVLLAALLLQWAFHQRDAIAAARPAWTPWLKAMCQRLHCEVGQLRQIESVVIDSSSFSRIGADAYRLGFSIKNAGSQPLAMPALEVTLTDTQDRTLLRRVLMPSQFGAGGAALQPGADFAGSVAMRIAPEDVAQGPAMPLRVTGYRVLAFYP